MSTTSELGRANVAAQDGDLWTAIVVILKALAAHEKERKSLLSRVRKLEAALPFKGKG